MRVNGRRAVGIGISTEADVDVVKAGEKIGRVLGGLTRPDARGHGSHGALS